MLRDRTISRIRGTCTRPQTARYHRSQTLYRCRMMCRIYLSLCREKTCWVHRGVAKSSSLRCDSESRNGALLLPSSRWRSRRRKLVQIRLRSRMSPASRCQLLSKRTQAEYRQNRKSGRPSVLSCRLCRQPSCSQRWKCPPPQPPVPAPRLRQTRVPRSFQRRE